MRNFQNPNSDHRAALACYVGRARRLDSETEEMLAGTRETIAESRALIAEVDVVLARVAFGPPRL
jgi:hypothetical protein